MVSMMAIVPTEGSSISSERGDLEKFEGQEDETAAMRY